MRSKAADIHTEIRRLDRKSDLYYAACLPLKSVDVFLFLLFVFVLEISLLSSLFFGSQSISASQNLDGPQKSRFCGTKSMALQTLRGPCSPNSPVPSANH